MSESCDVAIVGVTGMIGDVLIDVLDDHDFAIVKLYLVDEENVAGGRLMYKGQSQRVEPLERFDFSQVRVVVFLGSATVGRNWIPQILAAGCSVIDASGSSRSNSHIPMVVADANPQALQGFAGPGLVACPDSQVVQAVLALQPVLQEAGLQSVTIATYQSMSTLDQQAVEGLALQTGKLLNGQPPEAGALAKQAAFNLIPRTGEVDEHGFTEDESRLGEDVRRTLALPGISVAATCVVVPVFYGTAAVLQVRTREPLSVKRLGTLLRKSPGVKLLDKPSADGYPTPVTEATGSDSVWIGRLRVDPVDPLVLNMWIVSDNLRKGVVLNSLQTLRLLIKDYL